MTLTHKTTHMTRETTPAICTRTQNRHGAWASGSQHRSETRLDRKSGSRPHVPNTTNDKKAQPGEKKLKL